MRKELHPNFGFEAMLPSQRGAMARKLESIGARAVRRKFSPEFVNRLDGIITYLPLNAASLAAIVDHQILELEQHIENRLAERAFTLEVGPPARRILLEKGTSEEYGARELKRTILRQLTQPLAALVAEGAVEPGTIVRAEPTADGEGLALVMED